MTNIIVSVITACTAIVAIIISIVQISKSNKQSLFERRLNAYLKIHSLKFLCDQNKISNEQYVKELKKEPDWDIEVLFCNMTNISFLEELQNVIDHTLENDYQKKYLLKMEELKNLCEEVRLIFPEIIGYELADFVYYYTELLINIYKYKALTKNVLEQCEKNSTALPLDQKNENNLRQILVQRLEGTITLSERLFKNGTLDKVKKKIKL